MYTRSIRALLALLALTTLLLPSTALAQPRDGSHDFDFNFGTWTTHIKRLANPFTNSSNWMSYTGTVTVRKVWGGRANVEEIEADGPSHLEFANVRMYNKQSHQWSLNGASGDDNSLEPVAWGEFVNGRGTFYDQESDAGRTVIVRQTFYDITPESYAFEQALSADGGATWYTNFTAHLTRKSATAPSEGSRSASGANHDFDFSYGTWHTSIRSLDQGKNGDTKWDNLTGTVTWRKIWDGRGFLEEIKAGSGSSGFQGITLFLYSPQTHQWSQTYADSDNASFDPSMIGGFKNGRGDLVSTGTYQGRNVLLRESWSNITANAHHFEIAYSSDGGATWHPNFVANLTRSGPGL